MKGSEVWWQITQTNMPKCTLDINNSENRFSTELRLNIGWGGIGMSFAKHGSIQWSGDKKMGRELFFFWTMTKMLTNSVRQSTSAMIPFRVSSAGTSFNQAGQRKACPLLRHWVPFKGVRKGGGGVGLNPPPWAWYFTKFYYLRKGD